MYISPIYDEDLKMVGNKVNIKLMLRPYDTDILLCTFF
jgi:hypothetical protein